MSPSMLAIVLSSLVFVVLVSAAPTSLTLKRAFPNHGMNLSQLRAMDMKRHGRILQASVVNFPVYGTADPIAAGLYYTSVHLGSPPREFHVTIDTGSDMSWVNCVSCNGCPQTSNLRIKLNYFDPESSSTSSVIPCSHHKCAICSTNNHCSFKVQYEDGGETSGYIISDLMHVADISEGLVAPNSSVPLVFGCSNMRTGRLTSYESALDGIFGFGKDDTSLISQLYSQGKASRVFSHCLKGDTSGGGILVLGEVVEPNMSYTPLIPKQPHYNLNLESISVNGHTLQIDPTVFITSSTKGVMIDSGSTLAFFIEEAYNSIIDAINSRIPRSIGTTVSNGFHCYLVPTSIFDIFPPISLNFANHASMVLRSQDYLIHSPTFYGGLWCLGFHKTQDITILGDIILKDKIIVYDLTSQQIGWTNYNCSLPVNVSAPSSGKGRNEKGGASLCDRPEKLTMVILAFITHMILILI
ncbi:PREDICTED: aspartic proteinase-like protein 2 isoform X2 [Lupinus angustifolius]|uniref:aspartic proteinase-like protein 2 isoform X2 n=1 Tax=Lupinus angustifolius TaxID=3871 RepID=UPI00092E9D88|nr:PREDICTED: aspartic proteinase-like protein 2 isoform X2 [Lupinus angustifolius]